MEITFTQQPNGTTWIAVGRGSVVGLIVERDDGVFITQSIAQKRDRIYEDVVDALDQAQGMIRDYFARA